ncbi:hypothetical protein DFH11DRAFT_1721808 [Phellopilus nigrolimitatus]|nr:hypothetical protein DFH11DRAFT_1721808 [Phellopilus nigrolimitatus]
MPSIEVPQGYSYVLAAAASTIYLNAWQMTRVGRARKQAAIAYPQMYAEKAEQTESKAAMQFNCTQRAHQNTLESAPHVILAILLTGLKHPYLAAGLGGTWTLGRIAYTIGYSSGDPSKRSKQGGFLGSLAFVGFILSTSYTVFEFLKEGL